LAHDALGAQLGGAQGACKGKIRIVKVRAVENRRKRGRVVGMGVWGWLGVWVRDGGGIVTMTMMMLVMMT
jgi:hypothetical protein